MFTGLIQDIGEIKSIQKGPKGAVISIKTLLPKEKLRIGDSLATNGVCLTIVEQNGNTVKVEAVPETVDRTTIKEWRVGQRVNLEPALAVGDPLGGHLVQGHVDGIAKIKKIVPKGMQWTYEFDAPEELTAYMVQKGSITINGISLTIVNIKPRFFSVAVIPHTRDNTILKDLKVGQKVNIEVDIIGKYVANYLKSQRK